MPLSQPELNAIAFAVNSSLKNIIPSSTNVKGVASFEEGFPYETMVSKLAGGIAPSGKDFNGIFNQLSSHQVWLNAGGKYKFNAELANAIGGYHQGAQLISDDGLRIYVSTINKNTNNLNDNLTGWALIGTSELTDLLDHKYDKTGGTVAGDISLTGVLNINSDSPEGGVSIRPNSLINGLETQINLISGNQIECYYLDKPVRAPTQVGGQWVTLTGDQSIGFNQTWQDVTSKRVNATTYTNSTGKPIFINILAGGNDGDSPAELYVNSVRVGIWQCGYGTRGAVTISAIIPANGTYRLTTGNTIHNWVELR